MKQNKSIQGSKETTGTQCNHTHLLFAADTYNTKKNKNKENSKAYEATS